MFSLSKHKTTILFNYKTFTNGSMLLFFIIFAVLWIVFYAVGGGVGAGRPKEESRLHVPAWAVGRFWRKK